MGKVNIKARNGVRALLLLAIALTVSLSTALSAYAAIGDNVSYTSPEPTGEWGATVFYANNMIGTCCQPGVEAARSGTARLARECGHSTVQAKVAWYIQSHNINMRGNDPYPGFNTLPAQRVYMHFFQIAEIGKTAWAQVAASDLGYNEYTINLVFDAYDSFLAAHGSDSIPNSFKVIFCDAGAFQNFIVWGYNPTGYVKLKKVSGNTDITG